MKTQTFTDKKNFHADAYMDGKIWRWASNNAVVPVHVAKECSVPIDVVLQTAAEQKEIDEFISDYRKNHKSPSPEEMFETRAAFGPNKTVVDIITGERWTT